MASAYIRELLDFDNNKTYPVTVGEAVYIQETQSDGTKTQQTLADKLKAMAASFQAGVDTIVAKLKSLGVTPASSTPDGIASAIGNLYNNQYSAGQQSVTVSQTVSGRTVTATTSTGKTATSQVALGTSNGSTTFTLTPTGNNTATRAMAAGYYEAGTITADGTKSYAAGYSAGSSAGYSSGYNDVTVSQVVSGRTVTATASNNKTSTAQVALGTSNGNHNITLTPSGSGSVSTTLAAGYYNAGTVTASGGTAYSAGYGAGQASVACDNGVEYATDFDLEYHEGDDYFYGSTRTDLTSVKIANGVLSIRVTSYLYIRDGVGHETSRWGADETYTWKLF